MGAATYSFKGTADMSQHNQQIKKAKEEVTKYKDEVEKAQKETTKLNNTDFSGAYASQRKLQRTVRNTTTAMEGLSGNMMGAIKKFGPYAAAAAAGFGLVIKSAQSAAKYSDEIADNINGMTAGLDAMFNRLSYSLATLDFSNFISQLSTAYTNARNLYNAMDSLQTFNIINGDKISELETQLEEARYDARTGKTGAKERVKQLEDELEQAYKDAIPYIRDAKDKAMKEALAWDTGPTGDDYKYAGRIDEMWDMATKYKTWNNDDLDQRVKWIKRELKEVTNDEYSNPAYWIGNSEIKEAVRTLELELKAIERAKNMTDRQLTNVYSQVDSERAIRRRMAEMRRRDLRYTGEGAGSGSTKNEPDWKTGSIAEAEAKIKELQDKLQNIPMSIEDQQGVFKEIKEWTNKKAMLELQLTINQGEGFFGGEMKKEFDEALKSGDVESFAKAMCDAIDKVIKNYSDWSLMESLLLPNAEMEESAREAFENINKYIEEEAAKMAEEIKQHYSDMGDIVSFTTGTMSESMRTFADVQAYAFDAISENATEAERKQFQLSQAYLKGTATIIDSVGQAIPAILSLVSAYEAEALAAGTAGAAKLPFPANIGAIATVVGSILSVITAIASMVSASKRFAGGGIFKGSGPMIGDMHFARVNPGEMILNDRQQANLFRMVNQGGGNGESVLGGNVEFHISGTELVGVLGNYDRQRRRVS